MLTKAIFSPSNKTLTIILGAQFNRNALSLSMMQQIMQRLDQAKDLSASSQINVCY